MCTPTITLYLYMHLISEAELKQQLPEGFGRNLSMFGALSDDCLNFLLQEGKLWQTEAGDKLFSLGDRSDMFYILLRGSVRFFQPRKKDGEMVSVRLYNTGSQLGYVGMIGLHERRGDAVVEEGGFLLEISSDLFHRLCEQFPQMFQIFLINLTRDMSREISHLDQLCAEKAD